MAEQEWKMKPLRAKARNNNNNNNMQNSNSTHVPSNAANQAERLQNDENHVAQIQQRGTTAPDPNHGFDNQVDDISSDVHGEHAGVSAINVAATLDFYPSLPNEDDEDDYEATDGDLIVHHRPPLHRNSLPGAVAVPGSVPYAGNNSTVDEYENNTSAGLAQADVLNEENIRQQVWGEVEEELDQGIIQAQPIAKAEQPPKSQMWNLYNFTLFWVVFVVIVVAITVPTVLVRGTLDQVHPSPPTSPPTQSPASLQRSRLQAIQSLALQNAFSSNASLADESSPESMAITWLEFDIETIDVQDISLDVLLERYILAVLYYATNGPGWRNQSHCFLSEQSVCMWNVQGQNSTVGVFCDPTNHTQTVSLSYLGLHGSLPSEFTRMPYLQQMDMSHNNLTGTIPTGVEHLTTLLSMVLDSNTTTGSIPAAMGQLTALESLVLNSNRINGTIPTEIGQMTGLQRLSLSGNRISGSIPTEIGQLTLLQQLDLAFNRITGTIPTETGMLTGLRELILQFNHLSGTIPTEIGQLSSLTTYIVYSGNNISGFS